MYRSHALLSQYDIENKKKNEAASFVQFNKRAISLQSQELKKLQGDPATRQGGKKGTNENSQYHSKGSSSTLPLQSNGAKSMTQMHANFRQILKQTAKEQHEKRRQETLTREKHERAVRHLHNITRKVPPRAESQIERPQKERDYSNLRQMHTSQEQTLLKRMVNQELDNDCKALLDLAERVGYLDPKRSCSTMLKVPDTYTPQVKRTIKRLTVPGQEIYQNGKTTSQSQALQQEQTQQQLRLSSLSHHQRNRQDFAKTTKNNTKLSSFGQQVATLHKHTMLSPAKVGGSSITWGNNTTKPKQQLHSRAETMPQISLTSGMSKPSYQSASLLETLTHGHNFSLQKQQLLKLNEGKRKTRHEIYANFHAGEIPKHKRSSYSKQNIPQVKFQGLQQRLQQKNGRGDSLEGTTISSAEQYFERSQKHDSARGGGGVFKLTDFAGVASNKDLKDNEIMKSPRTSNVMASYTDAALESHAFKQKSLNPLTWSAVQDANSDELRAQFVNMTERNNPRTQSCLGFEGDHGKGKSNTTKPDKSHHYHLRMQQSIDIVVDPMESSASPSSRGANDAMDGVGKDLYSQGTQGLTSSLNGRLSQATTAMTPYRNVTDTVSTSKQQLNSNLLQQSRLSAEINECETVIVRNPALTSENAGAIAAAAIQKNLQIQQNNGQKRDSIGPLVLTPPNEYGNMRSTTQMVFAEKRMSFLDKVKDDHQRNSQAQIQETSKSSKGGLPITTTSQTAEKNRKIAQKLRISQKGLLISRNLAPPQQKAEKRLTAKRSQENNLSVPRLREGLSAKRSQENNNLSVPRRRESPTSDASSTKQTFTGLVQKGVIAKEIEEKRVAKEQYKEKMNRLGAALRKMLAKTISNEQMDKALTELRIKAELKRRSTNEMKKKRAKITRLQSVEDCTFDSQSMYSNETENQIHSYLKHYKLTHATTHDPEASAKLASEVLQEIEADEAAQAVPKKCVTIDPKLTFRNSLGDGKQKNNPDRRLGKTGSQESIGENSSTSPRKIRLRKAKSIVFARETLAVPIQMMLGKKTSIINASTDKLHLKLKETQKNRELDQKIKKQLGFQEKISKFRETIYSWVSELVKEDGKKDFDVMAKLISDYEQYEDKGIIGWAINRIQSISPTINQAEKKLNGVIDAVQYKYKRMMNFVLESNNFNQKDFMSQDIDDPVKMYTDEEQCESAVQNINFVHRKLEGIKEIIIDKMLESIQKMFENFVREFTHDRDPLFENKLIFYCILKTEGDIMIELGDYNKAIQAYKALRNYCKVWGMMEQEMWMAEQIGMCYRHLRYHELAVDYFKYQLSLAWELDQQEAEMRSYDNLSIEYYYIGDITKAKVYHERVFRGRVEHKDSTAKHASALLNHFNRHFKEVKYKFDQIGFKGTDAENIGKRANFGEYQKYIPKDEHMSKKKQQKADVAKLEFENAIAKDTVRQRGEVDNDLLQDPTFTDLRGMTIEQKIIEKHKRAARRNFLIGSRDEQEKIKERYKPANLRGIIKLKTYEDVATGSAPISREMQRHLDSLPNQTDEEREEETLKKETKMQKKLEKATKDLDAQLEEEFRTKIRKVTNDFYRREESHQKIYYTHMDLGRRTESVKDKPVNQLRNCRQYLDFMESYIHDLVKEHNQKVAANPQLAYKRMDSADQEGLEYD